MRTFWQKFWFLILGSFITVILSAASANYIARKASNYDKIENAAPKEYVDNKITSVETYVNEQNKDQNFANSKEHNEIKVEISKKASNEKVDAMLLSLKRVIEQNDNLYLFLLEQKGK